MKTREDRTGRKKYSKRKGGETLKGVLIDICLDFDLGIEEAKLVNELFYALKEKSPSREASLRIVNRKLNALSYDGKHPEIDTIGFRKLVKECRKITDEGNWKVAASKLIRHYPGFSIHSEKDVNRLLDTYLP